VAINVTPRWLGTRPTFDVLWRCARLPPPSPARRPPGPLCRRIFGTGARLSPASASPIGRPAAPRLAKRGHRAVTTGGHASTMGWVTCRRRSIRRKPHLEKSAAPLPRHIRNRALTLAELGSRTHGRAPMHTDRDQGIFRTMVHVSPATTPENCPTKVSGRGPGKPGQRNTQSLVFDFSCGIGFTGSPNRLKCHRAVRLRNNRALDLGNGFTVLIERVRVSGPVTKRSVGED
jgi:hypothetical protein